MRMGKRRDARGASVVEYALLMAMVVMVVFASMYALGRSPERPASVLSETLSGGGGGVVGPTIPPPTTTSPTSTTTSTAPLPPPP